MTTFNTTQDQDQLIYYDPYLIDAVDNGLHQSSDKNHREIRCGKNSSKSLASIISFSTTIMLCLIILSYMFLAACSDNTMENSQLQASAGENRNVLVGDDVNLNGSGSFDSQGNAFEYSWAFLSKPQASSVMLENATSATPSFTPDVAGKYKIKLTVSNTTSSSDTVTIAAFKVKSVAGVYTNMIPGTNVGVRVFVTALGNLIATCEFTEIGGIEASKIAYFNGSNWFALGCGLENGSIYDMIEYKGEIYVTGSFEEIGCIPSNNIARWDGNNWNDLGNGLTGGDNVFGHALAVYNDELYVGGQFENAGDISAMNIAKWDGTEWHEVGTIENGSVRALEVYKQLLYAGGFFTRVNQMDIESIASYDGTNWAQLGSLQYLELKSTGVVKNMAVFQDVLYMSGDFSTNSDDVSELITWNGSEFKDFGRAFSLFPGNTISELKVINDILYIGGEFRNVVGTQANNILQWDGDSWGIMSVGITGTVLAIELYKGDIYIGGDFGMAGGENAENISIWESN